MQFKMKVNPAVSSPSARILGDRTSRGTQLLVKAPQDFFLARCAQPFSSARTSSLVWTFLSKNSIRFCFSST